MSSNQAIVKKQSTVLITLLAVCMGFMCGCKTQQPNLRPAPSAARTPIDGKSADLLIDDASQYIAAELPTRPGIADAKYRKVLGLGPIEVLNFDDPSRFVTVMRSLNGRLMQNQALTNRFRMVQVSTPSAKAVIRGLGGAHSDDISDPAGTGPEGPATYDPRDIYILTGKFNQFGDLQSDRRSLRLIINIEHPQTRSVILSHEFRRNFAWDTASGIWEPVE